MLDWAVLLIWLCIPGLVLANSIYVWFFFREESGNKHKAAKPERER